MNSLYIVLSFINILFIHTGHAFPCFLHILTLGPCVLVNSLISIVMTNIPT